jgi:hypothetical protein
MNLFKDPNTLLGASQAYPRQLKKLRSLGMEALQGYDTWKTAMTEMLDTCNIGKAVTQGDLADLEAPTQIDDIVSTQQVLESVGLFEQSGDGGEKEVKSLPTVSCFPTCIPLKPNEDLLILIFRRRMC